MAKVKTSIAILREMALVRGAPISEAHKRDMIEQLELELGGALSAEKAARVVLPGGPAAKVAPGAAKG